MERELKGMERTILISNDIRPFNFQAVRTAITNGKGVKRNGKDDTHQQ